jgi:hypothetical protein
MLAALPIVAVAFVLPNAAKPAATWQTFGMPLAVVCASSAPLAAAASVPAAIYSPPMHGASDEVVGMVELLFLAGFVLTVVLAEASSTIATTASINSYSQQSSVPPLHLPHDMPGRDLAKPTTPHMAWLAGKPLPTLGQLAESCVLIAEEERKSWFICTSAAGDCSADEEFSDYYGQPVYICAK